MDAIRPWLYIGKYRDTIATASLQAAQIDVILTFAEPVTQPNTTCHYFPIEDGMPLDLHLLAIGTAHIQDAYKHKKRILVACGAGISRSATFVIAALKETEQLPLLQAAQVVHNIRPSILPHYALWQSLCFYYEEHVPYVALIRLLTVSS